MQMGFDRLFMENRIRQLEDWQPGDGGELKLWTKPGEKEGPFALIEPRIGTLVCFLAGDYWHEVMPARKTRMSITGWFRRV